MSVSHLRFWLSDLLTGAACTHQTQFRSALCILKTALLMSLRMVVVWRVSVTTCHSPISGTVIFSVTSQILYSIKSCIFNLLRVEYQLICKTTLIANLKSPLLLLLKSHYKLPSVKTHIARNWERSSINDFWKKALIPPDDLIVKFGEGVSYLGLLLLWWNTMTKKQAR